tara:strand:- start:1466 stop:1633 length:168 start_codon:yes stop_codon:yes gene_type:complete
MAREITGNTHFFGRVQVFVLIGSDQTAVLKKIKHNTSAIDLNQSRHYVALLFFIH